MISASSVKVTKGDGGKPRGKTSNQVHPLARSILVQVTMFKDELKLYFIQIIMHMALGR